MKMVEQDFSFLTVTDSYVRVHLIVECDAGAGIYGSVIL